MTAEHKHHQLKCRANVGNLNEMAKFYAHMNSF